MSVCSFVSAGRDGQKLSAEATERREMIMPRLSFMTNCRLTQNWGDFVVRKTGSCWKYLRKVDEGQLSCLTFTHMETLAKPLSRFCILTSIYENIPGGKYRYLSK